MTTTAADVRNQSTARPPPPPDGEADEDIRELMGILSEYKARPIVRRVKPPRPEPQPEPSEVVERVLWPPTSTRIVTAEDFIDRTPARGGQQRTKK